MCSEEIQPAAAISVLGIALTLKGPFECARTRELHIGIVFNLHYARVETLAFFPVKAALRVFNYFEFCSHGSFCYCH